MAGLLLPKAKPTPLPASGPGTTMTLPWPPSVNSYWRSVVMGGQVRVLISAKGREYRAALAADPATSTVRLGSDVRLAVRVILCPPDKRRIDLDNRMKGLLDGLTFAQVWGDDSQVDALHILRGTVVKGGAAIVTIREHVRSDMEVQS